MSFDRNKTLCSVAIACGLLPFGGCSNSDKPAPDPGTVNVVVDHGGNDSKTLPTKTVEVIEDSKSAPGKSGADAGRAPKPGEKVPDWTGVSPEPAKK